MSARKAIWYSVSIAYFSSAPNYYLGRLSHCPTRSDNLNSSHNSEWYLLTGKIFVLFFYPSTPFESVACFRSCAKIAPKSNSINVRRVSCTAIKPMLTCYTCINFRVSALNHCLSALNKFVDMYQDLPASLEIFAPVKEHMQRYVMQSQFKNQKIVIRDWHMIFVSL